MSIRINSGLAALCAVTLAVSADATDWPGFRGPNHTGAVSTRLHGDVGLTVRWKREIGSGYSAVVVAGDRVVTMFTAGDDDVIDADFETK